MGVTQISRQQQLPLPAAGKGADLNSGLAGTKQKKRGVGKSAQRANAWRNAKQKLSYKETMEMIDKRQRKYDEPSKGEIEDMLDDADAQVNEAEEREEE